MKILVTTAINNMYSDFKKAFHLPCSFEVDEFAAYILYGSPYVNRNNPHWYDISIKDGGIISHKLIRDYKNYQIRLKKLIGKKIACSMNDIVRHIITDAYIDFNCIPSASITFNDKKCIFDFKDLDIIEKGEPFFNLSCGYIKLLNPQKPSLTHRILEFLKIKR